MLTVLLWGVPNLGAASATLAAESRYYLPSAAASGIVTVRPHGRAEAALTVLTEAVAVKETGPAATVAKLGEIYTFSPSFAALTQNRPTLVTFWNLQPDDAHDFALMGPGDDTSILMYVKLPPLAKTSYVFTFHRPGLYTFMCLRHQPEMSGQFLVLPVSREKPSVKAGNATAKP